MRLSDLHESFDPQRFTSLIMQALAGSAPAITQFLSMEPEIIARYNQAVNNSIRNKDPDVLGDIRDIADDLVTTGHVGSAREIKNVRILFDLVRQAISQLR